MTTLNCADHAEHTIVLYIYFLYREIDGPSHRQSIKFYETGRLFLAASKTFSSPPICLTPLCLTVSRNTEAEILYGSIERNLERTVPCDRDAVLLKLNLESASCDRGCTVAVSVAVTCEQLVDVAST